MYLEELTGSITLENLEVECKARLDRNNPQSWIKTVGGFSNAAGGTFYIGAEDKTFKLSYREMTPHIMHTDCEFLPRLSVSHALPSSFEKENVTGFTSNHKHNMC